MQNSERQIALIKNVVIVDFSNTTCDLYLTDKRMVLIRTKGSKEWGGLMGGAVGGMVGAIIGSVAQKGLESRKKQTKKEASDLTLDELLAVDKKSFGLAYEDIEQIKFYKVMLNRRLSVTTKKTLKSFTLTTKQYEELSTILSTIPALKGKLGS